MSNRFHSALLAHGFHRLPGSREDYQLADEGRVSVAVLPDESAATFAIQRDSIKKNNWKIQSVELQGNANSPEEIPAMFEQTIQRLGEILR